MFTHNSTNQPITEINNHDLTNVQNNHNFHFGRYRIHLLTTDVTIWSPSTIVL